jgi:hypothetical protein
MMTKEKSHSINTVNQETSKKRDISTYLSIITLNIKSLKSPIKRYKSDWTDFKEQQQQKTQVLAVCKKLTTLAKTHRLKVKVLKIFQENEIQK